MGGWSAPHSECEGGGTPTERGLGDGVSEDDAWVMVACLGFAVIRWPMFFFRSVLVSGSLSPRTVRLPMFAAPMLAAAILGIVLKNWASFDVVADPVYLLFYMAMGAAWAAAATIPIPWLGLDYRDDVAERANAGASWAIAGGILGGTLPYIGSNIGDGPGWWVVIFTGGAATVLFFVLWGVFEKITRISESITIDRDATAGLRLGGLLVGMGLVLARSAAGNWQGEEQAIRQVLQVGLGAVALAVIAVVLERILKPTPEHPKQPLIAGVVPGLFYVGLGAGLMVVAGKWT